MPKTGYFPAADAVLCESRGDEKVDYIRFCGSMAAGGGDDGDVVFVGEEQQIAGLDWGKEAFDVAAKAGNGAPDDVFGTGWRCSGGDQNHGWLRSDEVVETTGDLFFVLKAGEGEGAAGTVALEALANDAFKEHAPAIAVNRVGIQYGDGWFADWPCLQDGTALFENAVDGF